MYGKIYRALTYCLKKCASIYQKKVMKTYIQILNNIKAAVKKNFNLVWKIVK